MKISGDFRARTLARQWLAGTFVNLGSRLPPRSRAMPDSTGY